MKYTFLLLTIIALLATSCSKAADQEDAFQMMYPEIAWNEEISLKVDLQVTTNSFTNHNSISFVIHNNSSGEFHYNLDEDRLIYSFNQQDEQWQLVNDRGRYVQDDKDLIVASKNDPDYPPIGLAAYAPSIPDLDHEIELRFVITGSIEYPDGEIKPAGAFVDIVISP
jgi:hypothetical protein